MTRASGVAACLAAALVLLAACAPPSSRVPDPSPGLSVLALGDSYTIGEGVAPEAAWPAVVARALRADGIEVTEPTVIAVTGWTTDELDAAITEREADLAPPYALVTLLIGVNDQYRGRPADAFRAPFRALLDRAVGFAGGDPQRVVVVSIPDWGVMPFAADRDGAAIAAEIDAYNAIARDDAEAAGAAFADVTPLSRAQGALVAPDGLHPSGEAYAGWAERIVPPARAALSE